MYSVILNSVVNVDKKYYPQIFSEQFNYAIKKKKIMNIVNEESNLDKSGDESDNDKSNECDEENKIVF